MCHVHESKMQESRSRKVMLSYPPAYWRSASNQHMIHHAMRENRWKLDLQSMVRKYVCWPRCTATAAIEERKTAQHSKITAGTVLSSVWTHVLQLSAWTLVLRKHVRLLQFPTSWQIDILVARCMIRAIHLRQLQIPHLESWQNHKKYVWQKEVTDKQKQPDTQTEDTGDQNT